MRFEYENNIVEEVSAGTIQKYYKEYANLISVLDDITSNLFKLTYNDYNKLPVRFVKALKFYNNLKTEKSIDEIKKQK